MIKCNIDEINTLPWNKTPVVTKSLHSIISILIAHTSSFQWIFSTGSHLSASAAITAESSPPENNTATREALTPSSFSSPALLEHTNLFSTASCNNSNSLAAFVDQTEETTCSEGDGEEGIEGILLLSDEKGTVKLLVDGSVCRVVVSLASSL